MKTARSNRVRQEARQRVRSSPGGFRNEAFLFVLRARCGLREATFLAVLAVSLMGGRTAQAQVKVVTTTPTYASIARLIGGEQVAVQSLMKGPENIHRIVATPLKILALSDADLFIHSGLDLEMWVPQLLRGARNRTIQPGQPGNVNCARGIRLKQVPQEISRSLGDLHVSGNPHYALDPINLTLLARTIRDALKRVDASHAAAYDDNYNKFEVRMKRKLVGWLTKMRPYKGTRIAGYHNVLPYFADRFGLEVIGYVEPKPGIEPSPTHIAALVNTMRQAGCRVLLVNTWANRATARAVADRAGAQMIMLPEWVKGVHEDEDCFALFDYLVDSLVQALEQAETQSTPSAQKASDSPARREGNTPATPTP